MFVTKSVDIFLDLFFSLFKPYIQDCSCCTLIAEIFALYSPEILAGRGFSRLLVCSYLDTLKFYVYLLSLVLFLVIFGALLVREELLSIARMNCRNTMQDKIQTEPTKKAEVRKLVQLLPTLCSLNKPPKKQYQNTSVLAVYFRSTIYKQPFTANQAFR